ncbi:MAG: beta-galactosidase [Candidatus Hydrogenedentes bacterium]|nr:beta-galactosidase [Candidatus Hydrogenedentota bacterium]
MSIRMTTRITARPAYRAALTLLLILCAHVCRGAVFSDAAALEGTWRFSDGAEFPGAKGALHAGEDGAARLSYDFSGGGNYVAAYFDLTEPAALASVRFRVRKPESARLTFRATDATDQTFQKPMVFFRQDWTTLDVGLGGWTGHWGGPNDGVMRPPVKCVGILVENQDLEKDSGEILLADLAGTAGTPSAGASDVPYLGRYRVTDFGDDAGFHVSNGSLSGKVLRATPDGGRGASLSHSISLFGRPEHLELRIVSGTPGAVLKMSIGSHFQNFERVIGTVEGGAQSFTVTMPPDGWTHSGAEEDSLSYPLRVSALVIETNEAGAAPEVVFDTLDCVTTLPRSQAVSLFSTLTSQDPVPGAMTAACRGWNLLDTPITGTLTMTFRDWEDRVLGEESRPWTLPAGGVPADLDFPVAVPKDLNFADAEFRFEAEGLRTTRTRSGFTRPMAEPGDTALRPESLWGMGVYLYRYPVSMMDEIAGLARDAGVKWSREEFSWAGIETAPGVYDFSFYDAVVDTALKNGISVYGLLSYWGRFTEPYTEKGIDDFCLWARATVRHFKDRVKFWEVYNEPNIFFWSGPKELYPVLLERCHRAIKEEDPEARVLGVSTAGIDRGFIRQVLKAGAPFDILTIHPYRDQLVEEAFMRELKAAADLVGGRPVWITEMGWSTYRNGGRDERDQAQLLARCYLSAVASGAMQNMGWYDFRDDGADPFYFEHNFGVLHHDRTPKPAYRALATVCRTLSGGAPETVKVSGDGVHTLRMGAAAAVWAPARALRVECRMGPGQPAVANLMGEPLPHEFSGGKVILSLRAACPVFLSGAELRGVRVLGAADMEEKPDALSF